MNVANNGDLQKARNLYGILWLIDHLDPINDGGEFETNYCKGYV